MRPLIRQLVAVAGQGVVPASRPIATADDAGLVRGDGCFDAMRVLNVGGRAVAEHLDEHLARFERSMTTLGLPFDEPGWRALIADALQGWTHPPSEAVLKLVATRGPESDPGQPTAFLTITDLNEDATGRARAGITVRLLNRGYASDAFVDAPWLLGGVKLLSYAVNAAAKRAAAAAGDDDALFVSADGYALEGPTSAMIVRQGERLLTTPTGATGILDSITARQVFARAAGEGIATAHHLIAVTELFEADGVWLASSIRGVCPVVRLDGRSLRTDADWNLRLAAWGGF